MHTESGFRIAPNWSWIEKKHRHHNWLKWSHCQSFETFPCFFSNFSYWSKSHVNIITGSGFTKIFVYKGLTRNPELRNTTVCVLPNIWGLVEFRNTKFSRNVSNEILLNAAKFQCCSKVKPIGGGVKLPLSFLPPTHTQIRVKPT